MDRSKFPRLATILGALLLLGIIFSPFSSAAPPKRVDGDPATRQPGEGPPQPVVPTVHQAHAAPVGVGHGSSANLGSYRGGGPAPVFVTPPASPTEVQVGMYLISLVEVSPPSESFPVFTSEMFVDIEWHDPRLAFDPDETGVDKEVFLEHDAQLRLERIWWPDIEFENAQGQRETANRELVIHSDGTVVYSERFQGAFTVDMNLKKFPFDHQHLEIRVESFSWDERSVVFVPLEHKTGYNEAFETLEWDLHDVRAEVQAKQEVRSPEAFSEYVYSIEVDRDPGFYLFKILAPLLIIVVFNWTTFWMPGEPASTRMERGVIALLTVVAFNQVVASNLPRIGYLTFMDAVVYVAFASVGLTMLTNVWAQRQEYLGHPEKVAQLDKICRIAFPAVFAVVMAILWVVYHR